MDVDLLKQGIAEAQNQIKGAKAYINGAEQEIADFLCPFSVGDEVMSQKGEKGIIASVSYCGWNRAGYNFKIFKIKKDGTPYAQSQHTYGESEYTRYP